MKARLGTVLLGMLVVSAGDHSVRGIAEGDGEDAGGVGAVDDWSVGDSPGFAGVGGMENARGFSSGGEPDVRLALNGDAGSAGGECAFAVDGWREAIRTRVDSSGCRRLRL